MKHILFPTVAAADAFVSDLQTRGAIRPEVASGNFSRRTSLSEVAADGPLLSSDPSGQTTGVGGTPEDAGAGAVKGTVAGLVSGAAVGAIGTATGLIGATAATVATGGLALPVILGMAALGSGVGAAVGAIGGAAGVDETDNRSTSGYDSQLDDDRYDRVSSGMASGGRAVAVDDNVPQDVLEEVMKAHDGHYV